MPSFSLEPFYLIAQALGLIAFGLSVWAKYQINDDRLKFFMSLQGVALALHWLFLMQWTAMIVSITAAIRNWLSIKYSSKILPLIFIVIFVALGGSTYQVWYNALPIIACVISTIAYFFLHGVRMRTALLIGSCLWLIHNIIAGSIGPALMEVAIIATGLTTIQRILSEEQKING